MGGPVDELAAVGGELVHDPISFDDVQAREALAQLARLRVSHVHTIADLERVCGGADERRLNLARALEPVEAQARGQIGARQARRVGGP